MQFAKQLPTFQWKMLPQLSSVLKIMAPGSSEMWLTVEKASHRRYLPLID
jgi:hypothetical protein